MKLKLTYLPEEAREAALILHFAQNLLPGAKVRRDKSKAPKLAVYLTINSRETLDKSKKTLDHTPHDVVK